MKPVESLTNGIQVAKIIVDIRRDQIGILVRGVTTPNIAKILNHPLFVLSIFRVRPYRVLEATYSATLAELNPEYTSKPVKKPAIFVAFTCNAAIIGAATTG